jgi:hypothetical protein
MRKSMMSISAATLLGMSSLAASAGFDGSVPLLCAVTNTVSCTPEGDCIEGSAAAVNLPVFFTVDVQNKKAQSTRQSGSQRVSEILSVQKKPEALVLFGADERGGWSATIGAASGRLTVTAAREGAAYIVFGACVPL